MIIKIIIVEFLIQKAQENRNDMKKSLPTDGSKASNTFHQGERIRLRPNFSIMSKRIFAVRTVENCTRAGDL